MNEMKKYATSNYLTNTIIYCEMIKKLLQFERHTDFKVGLEGTLTFNHPICKRLINEIVRLLKTVQNIYR